MTSMENHQPFADALVSSEENAANPNRDQPREDDFEDHLIDLLGAVATLKLVTHFDSPEGIYLIGRLHDHAEALRRSYYAGSAPSDRERRGPMFAASSPR